MEVSLECSETGAEIPGMVEARGGLAGSRGGPGLGDYGGGYVVARNLEYGFIFRADSDNRRDSGGIWKKDRKLV